MNWSKARVLVTGGTRGIGAELVRQLLERGAYVVSTGVNPDHVYRSRKVFPDAEWICMDQADDFSRADALSLLKPLELNIVIHNAGVQQVRNWIENSPADITTDEEMAINFVGPVELTRGLLPGLVKQNSATIVFVTSGLALAPKSSSPVYCASKAALRSFAKSIRGQFQNAGLPIKVIEALPPIVDTDMTSGRGSHKISAADAARQILDGIEKDRYEIDVGATRLLRMILRISPSLADRIMNKH